MARKNCGSAIFGGPCHHNTVTATATTKCRHNNIKDMPKLYAWLNKYGDTAKLVTTNYKLVHR